jgi:hypothetical protein
VPGRHKGNGDMIACITSLGSKWDKWLGIPTVAVGIPTVAVGIVDKRIAPSNMY